MLLVGRLVCAYGQVAGYRSVGWLWASWLLVMVGGVVIEVGGVVMDWLAH